MRKILVEILICMFIGGCFGWFVGAEWGKAHPPLPLPRGDLKAETQRQEDWKPVGSEIRIVKWKR